jgi:diacylglycerol diphosphate phosphatase / phosphatidate phosphatase
MTFPSGHSSAAFAGFVFLSLYFNSTLSILAQPAATEGKKPPPHWKLIVLISPLVVAATIAASKIHDGWHHPSDVVVGGFIGTLMALLAYRIVYQAIWNPELNRVPLKRR